MEKCEECGKKLGMLQQYHHPVIGSKFLVCGKYFGKVDKDMQRWSKFCLSDSFNAESFKIDIQDVWNKNISNDPPLQKWLSNLWIKIGH